MEENHCIHFNVMTWLGYVQQTIPDEQDYPSPTTPTNVIHITN
jgi:hypothetical protein